MIATPSMEAQTAEIAETIYVLVNRELARQHEKWGDQHHELPYWLGILGEEYGEVCKSVIEYAPADVLLREVVQLIAVSIRFAERATRP